MHMEWKTLTALQGIENYSKVKSIVTLKRGTLKYTCNLRPNVQHLWKLYVDVLMCVYLMRGPIQCNRFSKAMPLRMSLEQLHAILWKLVRNSVSDPHHMHTATISGDTEKEFVFELVLQMILRYVNTWDALV